MEIRSARPKQADESERYLRRAERFGYNFVLPRPYTKTGGLESIRNTLDQDVGITPVLFKNLKFSACVAAVYDYTEGEIKELRPKAEEITKKLFEAGLIDKRRLRTLYTVAIVFHFTNEAKALLKPRIMPILADLNSTQSDIDSLPASMLIASAALIFNITDAELELLNPQFATIHRKQ